MSRAVSLGSLNQDLMGIALSEQITSWQIYRFEKSVEMIILILLEHNTSTSPRPGGIQHKIQHKSRQRSKLCLTWVRPVCARRVVENEYGGEVGADGGQVFGVRSKVQRAVLSVVPAQDGKCEVWYNLHVRGRGAQIVVTSC